MKKQATDQSADSFRRGIQTKVIHGADAENPTDSVASPIFQSSTYRFDDPQAISDAMSTMASPNFYGRYGSPNTKQVELLVAKLEAGEAAIAVASGMSAVSLALLSHLQPGDHVLTQRSLYPTTYKFMNQGLKRLGITFSFVDQSSPEQFRAAIRPETRIIYLESPANPILTLTDLSDIANLAKSHGILTIADNTFATPYNQQPLTHGIDIVLSSATKYLSGHSDVVGGILVSSLERIKQVWPYHLWLGAVLHPFESWLLLRGLKTFALRMAKHNENALAVAEFLEKQAAIKRVFYPGLASHSQHDLANRQMTRGYGGMVSFELRGGYKSCVRLLERVSMIALAVSFGGLHSLITHPASTVSSVQDEDEIRMSGVYPGLIRLSVGLEDAVDIINDLDQALDQ